MTTMFAGAGQQGAVSFKTAVRNDVRPARSLEVSIEAAGPDMRLGLRGTLDTSSAACAYDAIVAAAAAAKRELRLDLTGLEAATRAGCRALYVAAKLLHNRGGRMIVTGARPDVERVLRHAGYDALFEFRESVSAFDVMRPTAQGSGSTHFRDVA